MKFGVMVAYYFNSTLYVLAYDARIFSIVTGKKISWFCVTFVYTLAVSNA